MKHSIVFLFLGILCFLFSSYGCDDDKLLNLKRMGKYDSKQNIKNKVYEHIKCGSLIGFASHSGGPSASDWRVHEDGYSGNCFMASNCTDGYIEFSKTFSQDVVLTFWTKSVNPGSPNRFPVVSINRQIINSSLIDGEETYTKWMKIQTATIPQGEHAVRIEFLKTLTYFSLYIDDIQFLK